MHACGNMLPLNAVPLRMLGHMRYSNTWPTVKGWA